MPVLPFELTSRPGDITISMIATLPSFEAACSGLMPEWPTIKGSAPFSKRYFTASLLPVEAAEIKAVLPSLFFVLISKPRDNISSMMAKLPVRTADGSEFQSSPVTVSVSSLPKEKNK